MRWLRSLGPTVICLVSPIIPLPGTLRAQEPPRVIVMEGEREEQGVAELVILAGSSFESPQKAGLASVMAGVLAAEVESGEEGVVLGWVEPDRLAFRVIVSPDSLASLVDRLLRTLTAPRFGEEAIKREKTRSRAVLQSQLLSPEVVAARSLTERVFPDHPYGNLETPGSLDDLSREDLVDFHAQWVRPGGALLVVGGIGPGGDSREPFQAAVMDWMERAASGTGSESASRPASGNAPAGSHLTRGSVTQGVPVHIVDVPGAARSSIHIGQALPTIPPREWAALTTGVELVALENARTFRRWESFQENLGPVPSVGGVTRQRRAGLLRFQIQVPLDETDRALQSVLEMTARAGRTLYTPERVEAVRERLLEGVRQERGTVEGVARLAAYYSVGLGTDPDEAFGAWLGTLDPYEVRDAMSLWLHVDSLKVVIAGDATVLSPMLAAFGPVTVSDASAITEANGNRPSPLTADDWAPVRGDALVPGRWLYSVIISGTERGEMVRELLSLPEDRSLEVRTVLRVSDLVQEASVQFHPASLEMIHASLSLSGGADEMETILRRDGDRVSGTQKSAASGVTRSIEDTAPSQALVGELLELALWQMELAEGDHIRLPFLDPGTGQGQIADVVVLGETMVAGPRGEEAALVVEVVTGGIRQRLYLRKEGLHIPLASEILGQSLRIELVAEEKRPEGLP